MRLTPVDAVGRTDGHGQVVGAGLTDEMSGFDGVREAGAVIGVVVQIAGLADVAELGLDADAGRA